MLIHRTSVREKSWLLERVFALCSRHLEAELQELPALTGERVTPASLTLVTTLGEVSSLMLTRKLKAA